MKVPVSSRLLFLTRALVIGLALVPVLAAAPAFAHDYYYWYSGAQTKVYPTTSPANTSTCPKASTPTRTPLSLSGARAEFEGRQLAIRPKSGSIRDIWLSASDLTLKGGSATISADEVSFYKVMYVKISRASYGLHATGYMPDPLVPMTLSNGRQLGGTSGQSYRTALNARTQPFYALFHIPDDAVAGTYEGTVTVTATGDDGSSVPELAIPVSVQVYPFSIAKTTLRTTFGVNLHWAMYANAADHMWGNKTKEMGGWLRYMAEHRVAPETLYPAWTTMASKTSARMVADQTRLDDYLGSGAASTFSGNQYGFNTVRMPEYLNLPYVSNPFASSSNLAKAKTYYSTLHAELGSYASRAIAYPCDEPVASKRAFIEKYAAFVHRYAPGTKFLLTTDPVTMNNRLIKGVDIYVQKLHFFYRDYSRWVAPIRRAGKQVWIYSHAGSFQTQTPNYLVDGPLASARANGWFAYHTNAGGLLYFDIAAWRPNKNSPKYRDPYQDPLSYRCPPYYANGDGSLVYPGYYPRYGLTVEGAPPVGSLRMEALRDGLEDYEYFKLYEKAHGRTATLALVGKVIGKPAGVKSGGKYTFPGFSKTPSAYTSVRATIAGSLSQ